MGWSSLITTVGSERPENITFQGKRQKKSAMGRSVPKRWAQVDFTATTPHMTMMVPQANAAALETTNLETTSLSVTLRPRLSIAPDN